ncbi:AAA family ATPase [Nibricoccus sp. IMCC34717]|uniref:AAA family ATPase n=1 Tax=Nibricoccus sp. IMCC34717 TaxID=3034021 RepID=UPI00384BF01F
MPPPLPHSLTGVLERIIFLNEETHYTIAEFRPDGAAEKVTVIGLMPGAQCGETLHIRGEWVTHAQHGAQFKVSDFKAELPSSVYGIRKYLGSGLVPGIGKVYANKIVDAFGTDTFRVLSEESARLRQVAGIGKVRAAAIKRAWDDQRALREIHIFLQTYGVTTGQCVKLVSQYGPAAKDTLLREPYRVAREIDGIGFKTADRIAINLGFANDSPPRLDAGLLYALEVLQEEGHTAVRAADLRDQGAELMQAPADKLEARLNALVSSGAIVCHADSSGLPGSAFLQLPVQDRAETKIATAVQRLLRVPSGLPPIRAEAALEWAEKNAGFTFADHQRTAVLSALRNKVSLLTGGPGTGKTTCLRALVAILKAKKARVHLAAPTGRAAQRLAESTGGFAQTLHRLLRFDPAQGGFTVNDQTPLATDFLIVDEASMLDSRLAAAVLQAVPSRAHLLLVGDTDQLPSVGPGNVLQDLISHFTTNPPIPPSPPNPPNPLNHLNPPNPPSPPYALTPLRSYALPPLRSYALTPLTRLTIIYRQKGQSQIVTTAHAINQGDPTLPPATSDLTSLQAWADLTFIVAESPEDCLRKTLALCSEHLPRLLPWINPVADIQVLAPMHKGTVGVASLNQALQAAFNPHERGLRGPNGELRPGDKVIQLRNNYDKSVFNGDIGCIQSLDTEAGSLGIDFDGTRVEMDRSDLHDLALAYAISIHKSQGSEYPVVVIPLLKAHFMMLQRNLLYTAITRGKKKVFLVGEPAAYAMAVRNSESKARTTYLREKLRTAEAP